MLNLDRFVNCCREISQQNKNIWVAYSGGVDSHVLLHLTAANFSNVRAVHIHHGLSSNADKWQQQCIETCTELNVPVQCIKVNAKPINRESPEDAARRARRKAWQDLLTVDDVLLVAHHADDQAETILYRLFRGTGPKGLIGMQTCSKIGSADLFRPLLTFSKEDILSYAQEQNLTWITDESNTNISFDRNFIRQKIIPTLTKRWPAVNANINRAGDLCGQLLQVVDPVVLENLAAVSSENNYEIYIDKLKRFSSLWRSEILRAWFNKHGETPSFNQLNLIQKQVIDAKIDANPKFILGNKIIRRSKSKLYLLDKMSQQVNEPEYNFSSSWDLQTDLSLPNGKILSKQQILQHSGLLDKLSSSIVVVKLGAHGDKAKKIFQKNSIPAWERREYPLLLVDSKLVCIVGLWVSSSI